MAEQGDIWYVKLNTETLSSRGELFEMMAELSGTLDGHKTRLDQQHSDQGNAIADVDNRLHEQRRDLLAALLAESSMLESVIHERASFVGKEISEATSVMDERQKRLVSQVRAGHALLQGAIGKSAAETQALIQAHDHQQKAQLSLVAEDADERANVFARQLKAEGEEREIAEAEMRVDIHSCSDRCAHLQQNVGDLRAVLRAQVRETVSRRDEADAAAVRTGLMPIGFGGTAIAAAAFVL